MKLLSLEKYLLKNDINDDEFKKLVIEISEKLELEALPENRKLTDATQIGRASCRERV